MILLSFGIVLISLLLIAGIGNAVNIQGVNFLQKSLLSIALFSYVSFWLGLFTNETAGCAFTAMLILAGTISWAFHFKNSTRKYSWNWNQFYTTGIIIVILIIPILLSWQAFTNKQPFEISREMFFDLPNDNEISHYLAKAIRNDTYTSPLFGDWLGSDRPPLQAGFLLMLEPVLNLFNFSHEPDFILSYIAQTAWIFGALSLLSVVVNKRHSFVRYAGITSTTFTGLILVNSVFTWPKLLAAGYLLLSVSLMIPALSVSRNKDPLPFGLWVSAGTATALASLSHGASLFAIIPLVLMMMYHLLTVGFTRLSKCFLFFLGPFVFLQSAWLMWQRFGDPPGYRLIKWHLAGVLPIDERGLAETLIDSYREIGLTRAIQFKWENIQVLFTNGNLSWTPYKEIGDSSSAVVTDFFGVFAAISWILPMAIGLMLVIVAKKVSGRSQPTYEPGGILFAVVWWISSVLVWSLLMFGPASTINHQGPLIVGIVPLLVISTALADRNPTLWLLTAMLQSLIFLYVYIGRLNETVNSGYTSVLTVLLTGALLFSVFHQINLEKRPDQITDLKDF